MIGCDWCWVMTSGRAVRDDFVDFFTGLTMVRGPGM